MDFLITVLGCNSAIPAQGRHPSAQVIDLLDKRYLIDAGEGAQLQFSRYRKSPMKVSAIFISHLHGDHIFGLPGLLTTMNLLGRTGPLQIFGPMGLEDMMNTFLGYAGVIELSYEVRFHTVTSPSKSLIYQDERALVYSFPLDHKVPTFGYLIEEKMKYYNLNREALERYHIPKEDRARLAEGADWVSQEGVLIPNASLTLPKRPPRRYAYCSDTRYFSEIIPWIQGADLLYHEATYLHEMVDKAHQRFHSTALQAGQIAAAAGVKKLLLGHFSSKYKDLTSLEEEARGPFPNAYAAVEGETYKL